MKILSYSINGVYPMMLLRDDLYTSFFGKFNKLPGTIMNQSFDHHLRYTLNETISRHIYHMLNIEVTND